MPPSFCDEAFSSKQRVGDNHTPTFTGDSSVCTWELLVFKLPDYQITQLLNPFGALGDSTPSVIPSDGRSARDKSSRRGLAPSTRVEPDATGPDDATRRNTLKAVWSEATRMRNPEDICVVNAISGNFLENVLCVPSCPLWLTLLTFRSPRSLNFPIAKLLDYQI